MFETTTREGVLQLYRPGTKWLSSGWNGGFDVADAAYNVSVPEGWERTDLDAYLDERLDDADFQSPGPTMLTGVDLGDGRGARLDPVVAFATVGLSNPATLPVSPNGTGSAPDTSRSVGTVNLVVGTTRSMGDGTLASLLATVVEAKTATLLAVSGFTGTTSDAAIVGCDPAGEGVSFAGSATDVGDAARVAVRDAILGALDRRYETETIPRTVSDADHGVRTDRTAEVFDF